MKSFTLVEFLLYIVILSSILILTGGFLWNFIVGNVKANSYQEVQQNGNFALIKITQEIKKASGINIPVLGSTSTSLSLIMNSAAQNPTVFDVVDGKLRITQGVQDPIELTSDQVIINNLQFTNLSYSGTPGTMRIEMNIDHINPANLAEYEASIVLKTTISLSPAGAP